MGDREAAPTSATFSDNWAYIKTEINWLDRLLALAIVRQRREQEALAPMTRSARDRVSQHWWKGLVTLDQPPNYDEGRPPRQPSPSANSPSHSPSRDPRRSPAGEVPRTENHPADSKNDPNLNPPPSYQQGLAARIQASATQGTLLSLPALQGQLQLSLLEKQVLLLGLAPEVNRRFSHLYAFLQDNETDLPQLDLALKLFCRTDSDWQVGRSRLVASPLVRSGLIRWVDEADRPQLRQGIQLAPALVDFLLAGTTTEAQLQQLLGSHHHPPGLTAPGQFIQPSIQPTLNRSEPAFNVNLYSSPNSPIVSPYSLILPALPSSDHIPPISWASLILPQSLKRELQHLSYRLNPDPNQPGTIALFSGASGTGKTLAARTIASQSGAPLLEIDLRHYEPSQLPGLLDQIQRQSPSLLLLRSARLLWTRDRSGHRSVTDAMLHRFWRHRHDRPCLTLLSDSTRGGPSLIPQDWQDHCDRRLQFPLPDSASRRRLWQRLLPETGPVRRGFPWSRVSAWGLSGGQIAQLAQDAARYAAETNTVITDTAVDRAWRARYNPIDDNS